MSPRTTALRLETSTRSPALTAGAMEPLPTAQIGESVAQAAFRLAYIQYVYPGLPLCITGFRNYMTCIEVLEKGHQIVANFKRKIFCFYCR